MFDAAASDSRDDSSASGSFAAAIPPTGADAEVAFISGVTSTGTIAGTSYWTWNFNNPATYSTTSFANKWGSSTPGTSGGNVTFWFDAASNWTAAEQTALASGLTLWSSVANITFSLASSAATANFTFVRGHDGSAYETGGMTSTTVGSSTTGSHFSTGAYISIDTSVAGFGPIGDTFSKYGGYPYLTLVHEIGHLLGLGHGGTYNGSVNAATQQFSAYDTRLWTVMSYINPWTTSAKYYSSYPVTATNWGISADGYYNMPTTPAILDILAIQQLYGAPTSGPLASGGQTFGFNTSLTGLIKPYFDFTVNTKPVITIWSGGLNNTLDLSGWSTAATINLNPGTFSSANGMVNNIGIAVDTVIETAISGGGHDTIIGNSSNNFLTGKGGNDNLDGGQGTDTAVYSGLFSEYQLVLNANGSWTISDLRGGTPDGTDVLTNIELLQFADVLFALGGISPPTVSSFSSDSGTVGDGISNDNTVTLTGTAEANSTVKVYDGQTLLGETTADGSGAWSYTTAALADGTHSLTATATDAADKTSAASAALNVTVDTAAPGIPAIAAFSNDSGAVGDGITSDNTLTLTGTAEANSTVKVYDGATLLGQATANGSGAWSYTTAALADGAHSLTAAATDAAGNISATSTVLSVTVDAAPPSAPAIASFSTDSGTAGDGITNDNTLTLTGTAENNSTVKVYDGATLLGTVTANGSGAWSYTAAALANGSHSLTATATDAAGNTSAASATLSVTVDAAPPSAPAIAAFSTDSGTAGDGITNDNTLTLTGTAEANSTVKVYDGASLLGTVTANGSGAWSYTTAALANGTHSLTATATDAAGNTSAASAALSVTVDAAPPSAPTIAAFSTDTGTLGDGITNDNTVTLTGTAEANSTVKVYDGATLIGTVIANGSGAWSYTTAALANGSHSLTATATDAAGNSSAASAALSVTVDAAPPSAPAIAAFSTDTGTLGDGITNDNTVILTGTAEANSTVKVYDGAALLGTVTANGSGAWSYTTAALANGTHSLTATATDAAGNTSAASATLSAIVDTVAPDAPAIATVSSDSGAAGDGVTNDNTLTLTGTAEANSTVKVYDGASLLGTVTADGNGAWSYTTAALANGSHSFTATAADAAGNTSAASATLNVTVDTAAPNTPAIAAFSSDTGTVGDGITADNTLTLTGTAEANSTVNVYDGASLLGTVIANGSGAWSYTTAALANGTHSLTATVTDAAGNTSAASAALSVTVDAAPPSAPAMSAFSTDTGTLGDGITADNTLTLTGTAEANSTVNVYDGATLVGTVIANGSGAWSYTTAALANGNHSFTATAADAAGNTSAASATLDVTVDTAAPNTPAIAAFSSDTGPVGDGITADDTLTLTGTAEANSTVKIYDGATLLGQATADGSGAWSYTTAALANGTHSLTATATDAAGNTSAATAVLNVAVDAAPPGSPAIASFSNDTGTVGDGITTDNTLTLTGTAEANSTVKIYDGTTLLGQTTADGSGAWSYTTAVLANGPHSLTATAADAAGNTSAASATFSVTIDTAAPIAPAIASFSNDTGTVGDGITADNTLTLTGTAEANSTVKVYDGATLLGTVIASGSGAWSYTTAALANGPHSLTATATDAAGNTGVASAVLNVTIDTAPPSSPAIASFSNDTGTVGDGITNDNILTLTGTAEANSTVKIYDGATLLGQATADGSGAWSYTTAALANGTHNFTATATDAAGNMSAASATLNVTVDTAAPDVPAIASFSSDTGTAGDGITTDNTLTLTGTAEANSTVKVYDGAVLLGTVTADGSGAWSYTTAALADGTHSLTATATDADDNTSAASAALSVTVDTAAPGVPTVSSFSSDTGVVGDGITADNTLTLTGTAEAGSTVNVYDGATLLGQAAADGSGAWSYTTAALANGTHILTATATDAAGNASAASATLGVTVDTAAPGAPAIAALSNDTGTVGDGITNDNALTLTGTAEANSTVRLYDGATLLGQTTADGSGAWSYTTGTLANGTHSLTATATDAAGNTGAASAALSVTVDAAAPGVPAIASFSSDSGTIGDGITNDNTLALTGTAEANSTVRVYDGATLLGTVTANGSGAWTYTTAALANGSHSLTATATDTAGNIGAASAALNVTVDTAAPGAPTVSSFSTDTGTVGDSITNDSTLTLTGTAEANSTVKVYDGATLLGAVTANGGGAWSYTTAALANGTHSLTATATDAAGNTGAASATLSVTVDTAAPGAPTIASFSTDTGTVGDGISNDSTLTLIGTAEANSTVKLYDGATLLGQTTADGSGAWSYTTAVLANGPHSLTATATDAAGNIGAASAVLNVTVDTAAPGAPAIAAVSTDSGTVDDGITNDSALTLTGTAEANSTVKLYDGTTLLGQTTADGGGAWSYTTAALANGAHSLTATATDAAGNIGAASAVLNVTVDTAAPGTPAIASFSSDTGTVGDGITNDSTLTLTGTAEANSTVKVYDGATLLGQVTADGSGAWSYTTAALANGTHSLTATATDAAGNASAPSATLNMTVDAAAPGAPVIATFSSDTGTVGDGITADNTIALTGMAEANSTVKVYDGASLLGTVTANGSGAWSYTTPALANGTHALTATATDAAGNASAASATLNVTVDTAAPSSPVIASFSSDTGTVGDGITADSTLTLTGTAEANSTVKVYDGAALLGTVTANGSGAWSYTTAALGNGTHSLTATATDMAGNTSAVSATLNVTIDTALPSAPAIASFSNDTGTVGDGITSDNTVTLTGTAEANSTVKVYDGAALLGTATANGSGAWSYTTVTLANGGHSLTATATDAAGNTSAVSAALTVTIDTTAPGAPAIASFSSDSGTVGDVTTNDNTLTLTGTAAANSTVKVYDGATLLGTVTVNGSGAWSYTTAALADGTHSLTATATDAAGNTSVASAALSVTVDAAAPSSPAIVSFSNDTGTVGDGITADNTLTLTGTAEANSTVKVYDGATLLGTVTANGSGAWSYTMAALANGTHTLMATATDAAGNISAASAALNVTVDAPVPSTPAIVAFSSDTGTVGDGITNDNTLTLTGTAAASTTVKVYDGATLLGQVTTNTSGAWSYSTTALADGTHSLTATATDAVGNTSTASAALNVTIDTAAPVAPVIATFSKDTGVVGDGITTDSTLTLTGTAEANSTVKVYDGAKLLGQATAEGNGTWSYTTAHLANGSHSLTATSTDVSSNASAASAALSVFIANQAPVVTTPGKVKASSSQAIELSNVVSAADADNDAVSYLFYDSTSGGGHFELNGVVQPANTIFAVAASQLSQLTFVPAQGGGWDDLLVGATDNKFSGWSSLRIDGPSSVNTAPVVTVSNPDVQATSSQAIALSTLVSAGDADNDAISYLFYDSTAGGGHFEVNGVVKQAGTIFAVAASQLSQVKFVPAQIGGSDDLLIGATDGKFSGWSSLHIDGPSVNTAPVVTVPNPNVQAASGATLQLSGLVGATDAQSDAFVYLFYDATPGGGHFEINGVAQPDSEIFAVAGSQLGQVTFVAGAGTDDLLVGASDGSFSGWSHLHIL